MGYIRRPVCRMLFQDDDRFRLGMVHGGDCNSSRDSETGRMNRQTETMLLQTPNQES